MAANESGKLQIAIKRKRRRRRSENGMGMHGGTRSA